MMVSPGRLNQFVRRLVLVLLTVSISAPWVIPGGLAVNVLVSSNSMLQATQYLNVSNFYVVMQPDCNIILYNASQPFMSSNIEVSAGSGNSTRNCSLVMQTDGNLVVYNSPNFSNPANYLNAVWASNTKTDDHVNPLTGHTSERVFNYMILKDDGSYGFYDYLDYGNSRLLNKARGLVPYVPPNATADTRGNIAYPFPPELAWKPTTSLDGFPYMPAEYFISQGSKLQTVSQRFILALGNDCNLQSKENGREKVLWETRTSSTAVRKCQLTLQRNGLLVLRGEDSGVVYWNSSKTDPSGDNTAVNWVLSVNSENGGLSVRDISNPSRDVLWRNEVDEAGVKPEEPASATVWIALGVLGGAFVVAMAALGLHCYSGRRILDPAEKDFRRRLQTNGGKSQALTQAKIKQATNNFGNVIGRGGFGDVFYGKLPDGQEVAAKVLSASSHQSKQEFYNEIELLSMVHHTYLVSLLGYSSTRKHQILIYEYMGGGDLRYRLQGPIAASNPLSWRQRTSITLQVAEGLEYLHDKCSPSIIHRDVKSTNILLTNKLIAKVADFGLSKLKTIGQEDATHITTVVKGTPGYLDPEYHETGLLTEKSDVYAFGIVLMEIFTGRNQMYIAHKVGESWRLQQFDGLADPNLGGDFNQMELVSLVELALWCARKSSAERPFMRQVVQRLRELGLVPIEPSQPEIQLGEEAHHALPFDIESGDPGKFTSDTVPFSESSSSGMSSEVAKYGGSHFRSMNIR